MRRFVEEFYLEPCEYYTDMLHGPLDPMLDYASIVDIDLTLDKKEFYIGLGRYKWCKDLLNEPDRLAERMAINRLAPEEIRHKDKPKFSSFPALTGSSIGKFSPHTCYRDPCDAEFPYFEPFRNRPITGFGHRR